LLAHRIFRRWTTAGRPAAWRAVLLSRFAAAVLGLSSAEAGQPPPTPPSASPPSIQDQAIRVYIECKDFHCDSEYLRTELTFVNHVRDRQSAQVHVLGTSQPTGSGGRELMLQFIGQERFAGRTDALRYNVPPNSSEDDTRRGLVRTIKVGLLRFVNDTPLIKDIQIDYRPAASPRQQPAATSVHDPWNFWVFRARLGGGSEGEESTKEARLNGSFSANRITEQWKISLNSNLDYRQETFKLEEDEDAGGGTFKSVRRSGSLNGLVAKSLTDHWSAGARASLSSSTYVNQNRAVRFAPGVEFDFFPYAEATRRQFAVQYNVGVTQVDYDRLTVFDKTSETLVDQSILVSLDIKQRWGTAEMSFETSQFLNDLSKNHLTLFGFVDLKLFRGFSFTMDGEIERIHDQVYLAAGEATTEEILVRQRQLLTGYRYDFSFGITYTFGSIFNNVVNPRFGRGPGGIVFF
jgi:hypothetical protein